MSSAPSPVQIVSLYVSSNLCFPLVAIVKQLLLIIQKLLVCLSRELKVGALQKKIKQMETVTSLFIHKHAELFRIPKSTAVNNTTSDYFYCPQTNPECDHPVRNVNVSKCDHAVHSPPQWHQQDRLPGRIHNRCTWSCQCHSE